MNKETTRKVVKTLIFLVFGAFMGVMGFLIYSEYSNGNLDLGVSIDYIQANVYEQKNYDTPKKEYFEPQSIALESGDIYINSFDFKLAANSHVELSMSGAYITALKGKIYINAPYITYVTFEDVNVFVEVPENSKVILDSDKQSVIYLDQQAEQRWLVDSFTTLPISTEKIQEEYKNTLQLLEDLEI